MTKNNSNYQLLLDFEIDSNKIIQIYPEKFSKKSFGYTTDVVWVTGSQRDNISLLATHPRVLSSGE